MATEKGLVKACHDCSEGGIGVAIAEMAFAGGCGATIHLENVPLGEPMDRDDFILFSESNSRFLVEVAPENKRDFEALVEGVGLAVIGEVTGTEMLEIYGVAGEKVVDANVVTDIINDIMNDQVRPEKIEEVNDKIKNNYYDNQEVMQEIAIQVISDLGFSKLFGGNDNS